MSQAMEKMLSRPDLSRVLAVEANQQAQQRFHPVAVAKRHLEIYRSILT